MLKILKINAIIHYNDIKLNEQQYINVRDFKVYH